MHDTKIVHTPIDRALEQRIFDFVDALSDELIAAIRDIVRIKSVQGDASDGAPFGLGPRAALDATLDRCRRMGYETRDLDGYLGYATWGTPGDDGYVCALGHLDVVPEGEGWNYGPYSGHLEDGVIYSRGVLDNKGPIYACLYAMEALRRAGIKPVRELRIMFGCNEESGFGDLVHYLETEPAPVAGFTPDCKYPVVYAERGRALVRLVLPSAELNHYMDFVNTYVLNAKPSGERLGVAAHDDEFGDLEVRNYRLLDADGMPAVELALSYPANVSVNELLERLRSTVTKDDATVHLVRNFDPVRFERDCQLCRDLQYAYERVTGADGTPVTTTGGTYAKLMPNIVPFGPSFPGQKGIGHQPNEWMTVADIITNAKIYALALYLLACSR